MTKLRQTMTEQLRLPVSASSRMRTVESDKATSLFLKARCAALRRPGYQSLRLCAHKLFGRGDALDVKHVRVAVVSTGNLNSLPCILTHLLSVL